MAFPPNPLADFGEFGKLFADMKLPAMMDMDAFVAASRRNIETLTAANRIALEGAQTVARRHMEIVQQSMAELTEAVQAMSSLEAPQVKAAKQAELLKQTYQRAVANLKEVSDLIQQSNAEALKLLNARFAEAMDEVKALAEKSKKVTSMLDNPPLLTIHRGFRRPDKALIEAFRGAQTSHLADAMDGRGALDYRIKPLDPANASFVGPALTAFAYPADIAAMFGALAEAEPGDVIVVANDGYTRTAVFGDIAAGMMKNKGVAAFVTDGLARDKAGIVATGLPVFCQGIQPNSPAMNGPGVVGAAVTLGDVHVEPGDLIVGDADGVVVVPAGRLRQVLDRLARVRAAETRTIALVEQGATMAAGALRIIEQAVIVEG